jgi:penicillin-binding protein 1B
MGIDLWSIARAAWVNVTSLRIRQGGSTVTQQLVKLRLLSPERTFLRKIREVWLALVLERFYSKDQILEAYLNEVGWGTRNGVSIRGIAAASRVYFRKELYELTITDMALLAAMVRAPNRYGSDLHRREAKARRDWILRRMHEAGDIDRGKLARAERAPVRLLSVVPAAAPGGYFVDMVRREVREMPGEAVRPGKGDVRITTTLDWSLQRIAESAVTTHLAELERRFSGLRRADPTQRLQAVLIALEPRDGEIRALVGGRDYRVSQFNRALYARRQPGSAFKPFVYAAALTSPTTPLTPVSLVEDSPIALRVGGTVWSPRNHGGRYEGWVPVRRALADSLNAATVRVAMAVGLDEVVRTAKRLGIEAPLEPVPAIALGAFEVTPLELARAYLPFANGGWRPQPTHVIKAIEQAPARSRPAQPTRERVLSAEAANLMTALLQDVVEGGTGSRARVAGLLGQLAGKTGTTNEGRDAWFVGYSSRLLTLVWVGFDDGTPHGLTGAEAAVPIWAEFMHRACSAQGHRPSRHSESTAPQLIQPSHIIGQRELSRQSCT